MEATSQATVDVGEAKMKGEVGSKLRQGQTLQNAAKIDSETKIIATQMQGQQKKEEIKVMTEVKVFENEREAEVTESNVVLAMKKAKWVKDSQVAEVEASKAVALREAELQKEVEMAELEVSKAVALREAELQKEVEIMNTSTRTEKLKAEFLSKVSVEYETKVQEAKWELYKKRKAADASLYEKEKEAEAQKVTAEATLYSRQKVADGELYAKQKEAEGLVALAQAQDTYIRTLLGAFGGNYPGLRDYLMIYGGMYQEIAKINGEAVKGLQPKISISAAGASGGGQGGDGGSMQEVAGVYKMLPLMYNTVHDQTQMLPPTWMGELKEP